MSLSTRVPSDVEPDTIIDLVDDCREVTGVLGLPSSYAPLPRLAHPVEIDLDTAARLEGYEAYGS